jgi:hypothetical protein
MGLWRADCADTPRSQPALGTAVHAENEPAEGEWADRGTWTTTCLGKSAAAKSGSTRSLRRGEAMSDTWREQEAGSYETCRCSVRVLARKQVKSAVGIPQRLPLRTRSRRCHAGNPSSNVFHQDCVVDVTSKTIPRCSSIVPVMPY